MRLDSDDGSNIVEVSQRCDNPDVLRTPRDLACGADQAVGKTNIKVIGFFDVSHVLMAELEAKGFSISL